MAFFDDHEDDIVYGRGRARYERDDDGPASVSCNRCGKTDCHWIEEGDRWVLLERGNRVHKCANPVTADDFDVIE